MIRLVPLQAEHIQETAELVTRTACEFDPVGKILQIPYQTYLPIIFKDVQRCQKLGKSLVALDGQVIAGFLLLDVYPNNDTPYDTYFQSNEPLAIWYDLLFAVRKCFFFEQCIQGQTQKRFLYGVYGGVAESYANKNISSKLNARAMQQFGHEFDGFFGECTHVASKKVAARLGGVNVHEINYDTFWSDRSKSYVLQPLASVHKSCALMFIPFHKQQQVTLSKL